MLDGKHSDFNENDLQRRNRITKLLSDWGLVEVVDDERINNIASVSQIKILPHKEKHEWTLYPSTPSVVKMKASTLIPLKIKVLENRNG